MRRILIAAALALGAALTPAAASEAYSGAAGLDRLETTYVRHNREHRMWEIRRTQEMQQRRGRGWRGDGYGYRRGGPPAYGRRYRDRGYDRY